MKSEYLTAIPEGTPLGESNAKLSEQIMGQKDVLGTQIYEQMETVFGDITFNAGVDKAYASQLIKELLAQMKDDNVNHSILHKLQDKEKYFLEILGITYTVV